MSTNLRYREFASHVNKAPTGIGAFPFQPNTSVKLSCPEFQTRLAFPSRLLYLLCRSPVFASMRCL